MSVDIIWPNKITDVSCAYANADFPVENVLNNNPGIPWKTNLIIVGSVTLTCNAELEAGKHAVALHNFSYSVNPVSVNVTVNNVSSSTPVEIFSDTMPATEEYFGGSVTVNTDEYLTGFNVTESGDYQIEIEFVPELLPLNIYTLGIVRCGPLRSFGMKRGFKRGFIDRDVKIRLNDKTVYVAESIPPLRTFTGNITSSKTQLDDFCFLGREMRNQPMSMRVDEECLFGQFDEIPDGSMEYTRYSPGSFYIREVA